jgi:cysteine synthase
MTALSTLLGRRVGPSTGTNLVAMLALAEEMKERGEQGSLLSLLCDSGERYLKTYFDPSWVQTQFGDIGAAQRRVAEQLGTD